MAVVAATTLFACGRGTEPTTPVKPVIPTPGPVVAVAITPPVLGLIAGRQGYLNSVALDAKGRTTNALFEWSSADPTIATVEKTNGGVSVITAIAAGTTTVTATVGTFSATASVSVRLPDPPVAAAISPAMLGVIAGGTQRLTARTFDAAGQPTNDPFEWSSADPAVATVGRTDGLVTAIAAGSTTITVSVGTVRATATVSVTAMAGSFAFTRFASPGPGRFALDVLSSSSLDRTLRSLPRPAAFTSIAGPAWSRDGTQLVVEVVQKFFGPPEFEWLEFNSDLYVLDPAAPGSPWRALTNNGLSTSASWSPDGTRIAYLQEDALFANNQIYVIAASGGAATRLTRTAGYYSRPRWSPDGTRLAFSAYRDGSDVSEMFIVNADGSGLTSLTPSFTFGHDPDWSPDGTQLAFIRWRNDPPGTYQYDVSVVDVDGRNVRRLTTQLGYASAPAWSPDGRQIMFASTDGLQVMNADGSSLTRLTTPPPGSWDGAPAWRR